MSHPYPFDVGRQCCSREDLSPASTNPRSLSLHYEDESDCCHDNSAIPCPSGTCLDGKLQYMSLMGARKSDLTICSLYLFLKFINMAFQFFYAASKQVLLAMNCLLELWLTTMAQRPTTAPQLASATLIPGRQQTFSKSNRSFKIKVS